MRWWPVLAVLAACGDDLGEAPATLVRVTNTPCDGCQSALGLSDLCNNYIPPLDTAGGSIEISTPYSSTEIAGLVEVQYATMPEYEYPQLDFVLLDRGTADVQALFGARFDPVFPDDSDPPLYRMRPDGDVFDVDVTRLTSADDNALHFTYVVDSVTVTEDHVFERPRQVVIDASADIACCSAGRPTELGLVFAVLLIRPRRRRKLRA